ncbi:YeeE/YedE thiosulfate transporter family protein [uncultured Tateyamaria sp.]|uniref:YeeE/YedE thiosulfate transporter family protein n=1 Tax=uncultured Tateyamaria sp. TaxID=455651 RepID=UPI00261484B8|nr:YeeE/YedE thiosulfate transporter family protein [uncultured Tateyamaria sp.]
MADSLTIAAAFVLGFALSRASTCTVAATMRLVTLRRVDWLLGIAVAVSWSAVAIYALRLAFPESTAAPDAFGINTTLIVASVVMGAGAWLNGGCFVGSVGHISSGNVSYVATFAGLAAARLFENTDRLMGLAPMQTAARLTPESGGQYWALLGLFALLLVWSMWRIFKRRQQAMIALSAMGVAAAVVYSLQPDWSYEALIGRMVHGQDVRDNLVILLAVIGLFSGATLSAMLNNRFQLRHSGWRSTTLSFAGGLLMGIGAQFVPGGNDTLLLWVIPGFALHGLASYLIMVGTVAILIMLARARGATA